MRIVQISFLLLLAVGVAQAEELTFKLFGKEVKKLTLEDLKTKLKSQTIKVYEGHIEGEATYEGYPFPEVLNLAFGKNWKKGDDLLVSCSDGYQPAVSVSQVEKHAGFLVVKRTDGEFGFKKKTGGDQVGFGPFYLVWENLKDKAMEAQGLDLWPYQMTTVDVIHFADRFPNVAPPAKSSEAAKRGFTFFRNDCMHCHAINGEGSSVSMELNYPVNVTEYFQEKWLKKWILDPSSVRFNAKMPGLSDKYPNREAIASDLVAYLKAIQKNKKTPKSSD